MKKIMVKFWTADPRFEMKIDQREKRFFIIV